MTPLPGEGGLSSTWLCMEGLHLLAHIHTACTRVHTLRTHLHTHTHMHIHTLRICLLHGFKDGPTTMIKQVIA